MSPLQKKWVMGSRVQAGAPDKHNTDTGVTLRNTRQHIPRGDLAKSAVGTIALPQPYLYSSGQTSSGRPGMFCSWNAHYEIGREVAQLSIGCVLPQQNTGLHIP